MTLAKEDGIKQVAIGSAGNAAAAVAAYAAKADMECFIMLPPGAVKERAWQNMAYGGHFIYGLGGVNDCVKMAEEHVHHDDEQPAGLRRLQDHRL